MQTAPLSGKVSQLHSGPKPGLAEFGNLVAENRTKSAIAAPITSAIRSRYLIGSNRQII